ncbi:Protein I'm not dead yet [Cryptotermes secundus]|uniref:Protein I'm not dead yet n=1 Tax=Cryptotermes secundus TaxID=105785 RepID=A0A2J7QAM3_9NEOP|nr:protein I'm not dead yet [Cryptotermes secundus]PNF25633.1 Protein I'm not dead yet [Cryptotermes secundus]
MTVPFRRLLVHWRSLVIVLVPLALSPLIVLGSKEAKCGYVVMLMSVYWMTEAVPLAVTSFVPVILFPLLDILDTEKVCNAYLKETNMMFIGGLIAAIAVEHCNLHKRIALKVILTIGTSPVRLLLGFMVTTMTLSMWISNTATTAMMTPIVKAVLDELKQNKDVENRHRTSSINTADSEHASGAFDPETRRKSVYQCDYEQDDRPEKSDICYYLGVAYASNLGGAGTLTGTGTNLTFKGIWDTTFPVAGGVNFASWFIFGAPLMLINMLAAWIWLQILFMSLFRKKKEDKKKTSEEQAKIVREVISVKYKALGPMTFHEGSVLILFIIAVFLWFFRKPEFISGWAQIVASVEIDDATPVMLIVFLLFVLPANLDFLQFNSSERRPAKAAPALLTWKVVHEKVPWGLVCLLGGGFAMAAASNESGLSTYLGKELVYLQVLPPFLILIIVATATTFLTEVSSNTAVANIILPVLAQMAVAMKIHPLYFMIPATLCCSYAFMLPVATPPNAIVLAASNMKTTDMMKAGIGMNVICIVILCIVFLTYGSYVYDLDKYEEHHFVNNVTLLACKEQ